MPQNPKRGHRRDEHIISLLNQLGERMIRSERNRSHLEKQVKGFSKLFDEMEDKAANSEKIFLTLQDKLSKQDGLESTLKDRQDRLEKQQKIHEEKLQQTEELARKMEEALAQQHRMARRLEKITADRVRMLRKLERIEDTVIETRESLNSKALVLLTDQAAAAQSDAPQLPADPQQDTAHHKTADNTIWNKLFDIKTAGTAALIIFALFSGWSISMLQNQSELTPSTEIAQTTDPTFRPQTSVVAQTDTSQGTQDFAIDGYDALSDYYSSGLQTEETGITANNIPNTEALLAQMETNPDAVAATLNAIEPATAKQPEQIEKTAEEGLATKATKISAPAEQTITRDPERDNDIEDFVRHQILPGELASRIKPDSTLPPVIKEIEKKAFDNIPEAQHDLAAIYTAGHGGVAVNYERAAQWFREAAAQGVANARYNLGVLYHQGLGVDKNVETALGWYRAAAQVGHPEAQYNLGIAHIEGIGTEYSPRLAAAFFEQAAQSGIVEAAYNLGLIHENGLLGSTAPKEALFWYNKASEMGSPEAKAALDQLAKSMSLTETQLQNIFDSKPASIDIKDVEIPKQKTQKQSSVRPTPKKNDRVAALPPSTPTVSSEKPRGEPDPKDQAIVAQIQEQLMRIGLYPGPADGINGSLTQDAVRAYQAMNALEQSGRITEALLAHMLTNELNATLTPEPLTSSDMLPPGEF